ncbi:MAG: phenylalanine--tRNA ligase subunit beta [Myxococcota bacterium]
MRASYNWLKELTGVDVPPDEVAERLTAAGVAVDAVERHGDEGLDRVVVAEVRGVRSHPKRDKLSLVTVFDGEGEHEVVCGAPNVPGPGGRVLFARLGAELPGGLTIEERKIGGAVSRGMICSEAELDIGADAAGILVLGEREEGTPGQPAADALDLRDAVLELDLTPNRPDCLGHVGIAREVALLFGTKLRLPEVPALEAAPEAVRHEEAGEVRVDIEDPARCPRYGAALVTDVRAGPSPFHVRHRLHLLGLRPLSNLVDATNWVLLEWGHPIHGFDLARVRGRRIVVRLAREGERMATLDGVERAFTGDDLLICDGEGPVAVAGVMGGENSEIGDDTTDVLIECAYFDPRSVRRTARRLGMHTDASHRFERGVDPGAVPRVLARAADLLARLGGGRAFGRAVDAHPQPAPPKRVRVRPSRVSALLGADVPRGDVRRWLEGVGCALEEVDDAFEATVPTWRPDIGREVDLIEEVARLRGYDAIPTAVPRVRPSEEGTPAVLGFARRARQHAAAAGLTEVVSYAFLSRRDLAAARASTDAVALANPLSEERAVMRTSLLPGLAAAAVRAQRRQVRQVRLFEAGRTYHPSGERLPEERRWLACLMVGPRPAWIGDGEPMDFYDAKGAVSAIVEPLLAVHPAWRADEGLPATYGFLHPRRCAAVEVAGRAVGVLGELHPDVAEALELEGRPVYAELSVEALFAARQSLGPPQAPDLPRYPAVMRDIAMVVPEGHPAGAIADSLREAAGGLAESVELFDMYRGKPVPEGHKSLAFRIVYRDPDATLTDERVDRAHAQVAAAAERLFQASLR